jgi:alpha-L-arabinofuranosidase
VQDALDAIQYANGDTGTVWGAQRAANGHVAPFNLKYIEIGNENGGNYYNDRYALFYDAIKSNYRAMHIIANVWGGIPSSRPVEIQDEHYYLSPAAFSSYATKYDSYSRAGPKVFVGEYAVTSGYGTYGNLAAALAEACFMTGMERNSDIVLLASYAPLFQNVNFNNWRPDLIYYDNARVFGTPSCYVQRLFSRNRGEQVLPLSLSLNLSQTNNTPHGAIGLGSWNTSVQYTNIMVTSNGVTLYQSDFLNAGTNGWRVYNGTWSTNAGLYQQTALITDCRSTTGNTNWANYTITLRARKVSGSEGFLILFDWQDDNNWIWWNIGGWGNTLDGIEQMFGGTKSLVGSQVAQTITANVWYDIRIVLTGQRIQCYLNSTLIQDVTNTASGTVVGSASYSKSSGQVIVKAVNTSTGPVAATFKLTGLDSVASSGSVIQLTSANAADGNSFGAPAYVSPVTNTLSNAGTNFLYTLPANSLSILRLQAVGIHGVTNLQLQISSPLNVGQVVSSSVLAQESGGAGPFDLTTNVITARAISYWAANTTVAVVDASGNVAGAGPGTTHVVATYNGISATQTVQVVGAPIPPTKLIHRYSFNDGTANDSVGTNNGTFFNPSGRASITNNQLFLVGSNSDYVDLGPNLITPNAISAGAVTLEAWATFYPVNGAWTRLFDFGAINGSVGADYIFLSPNNAANGGNARLAVSDTSPGNADETGFNFSNLLGQTNAHIVAVFNPRPARQFLGLYLNGSLVNSVATGNKTLGSITNNYSFLGRSLYSGDAWLAGSIDEFRLYDGELHADEMAATQLLGPNQVLSTASPVVIASAAGGNLTLSWPLASAGFALLATSDLLSGNWTTVSPAPQIAGNQWQVTVPFSAGAQFYRLQK